MSHEVNNTVASSTSLLQSSLTYARELAPESRRDFETALGVVIARTGAAEHVHEGLRRRLPPAGAGAAAVRAGGDPRARGGAAQRQAGSRRDRLAVGAGRAGDPRQRRSGAARTGHPQRRQERRRGDVGDGTAARSRSASTSKTDPPTLVVEDSGAGLTAEAQANLFTPFFSTKPGGQGIGLTLVGEILAGHGFDYALERTDPRHHRLPHHVHLTTSRRPRDDAGARERLRSRLDAQQRVGECCDAGAPRRGLRVPAANNQWTRKVTPVHCLRAAGAGHRRAEAIELAGLARRRGSASVIRESPSKTSSNCSIGLPGRRHLEVDVGRRPRARVLAGHDGAEGEGCRRARS